MVLKDTHRASINIDKDNKIPVRVVHGNDAENIALYLAGDEYKDTRYNDVQVDFYDNMLGMVRTMCNVVIKRNSNYPSRMDEQWMGDCTIRTVQEIVQRQKDVRANVSIEIPFSSEKRADFYGTVTNISAGGIFMITSEELEPGEVLSFRYMFHTMDRRYYVKTVWRRPRMDISATASSSLTFRPAAKRISAATCSRCSGMSMRSVRRSGHSTRTTWRRSATVIGKRRKNGIFRTALRRR